MQDSKSITTCISEKKEKLIYVEEKRFLELVSRFLKMVDSVEDLKRRVLELESIQVKNQSRIDHAFNHTMIIGGPLNR